MGNPHWLTSSADKRAEHTMTKLKPTDLAHYYLVNDLPGTHIPATRLYNILDSLQKGYPPTLYALSYLQKQGLVAFSLFAHAKITYEAFRDAAAVEQAERKPALEAELLARRTAEMAREAAWEAEFHSTGYKRTGAPWSAVNASSEYRKSKQAEQAHALLITIPDEHQKTLKLKSAIRTTHGGALRDMQLWGEAISLGTDAHTLAQRSFHSCTLLGSHQF
jgi:hypothetical protein